MDRSESVGIGCTSEVELRVLRAMRAHLRALGGVVRLQVLHLLAGQGEMNVTDLARALRVSQPLVSWHLGVLRRVELVSMRRQGRQVWYSLNRTTLTAYRARLDDWLGDGVCAKPPEEGVDD